MCQVSVRCFRHSRWRFCGPLFFKLLSVPAVHPFYYLHLFFNCSYRLHTGSLYKISSFAGIHTNTCAYLCVCVCVCLQGKILGWGEGGTLVITQRKLGCPETVW